MESQAPKVELKEIGLDVGLAVARHFYKTEYLTMVSGHPN